MEYAVDVWSILIGNLERRKCASYKEQIRNTGKGKVADSTNKNVICLIINIRI